VSFDGFVAEYIKRFDGFVAEYIKQIRVQGNVSHRCQATELHTGISGMIPLPTGPSDQ
jgi:hypothetical protein